MAAQHYLPVCIGHVAAIIGIGVVSALIVGKVAKGQEFTVTLIILMALIPLSSGLHYLESWLAHDLAYRLLAELRVRVYQLLDRLAPAYLFRRRSGDLVSLVTADVETIELFFAHTIAPGFVAIMVPARYWPCWRISPGRWRWCYCRFSWPWG